MTYQKDSINLGKNVFGDNNQERKFWACLGQTCSRSLIVFLSQNFVILLIIFGCFWRIHLSKTFDESTVWVGILCSAAVYKILNELISTKSRVFTYFGRSFGNWKIAAYSQLAENWNISAKVSQNLLFLSTFPTSLRCYAQGN